MLESMRKHMKWLMWATIILITVTFLFFGIYPSNVGGGTVANVGGDVISNDDFNRVYRNMYETYRSILKDQFNEAMAKDLRKQALQEMITERLLTQEAERVGLQVSDNELQAAILKEPAFLRDGKFDKARYARVLDSINMKPAVFEANQRRTLLRQKLVQLIQDGVAVTETELAAAYKQQNPKAKPGDFEKNRDGFRQVYLTGKQREAFSAFIRGIYDRDRAKITINDKFMAS
jgi:peptidyl-prolyl cis-trans isomerase D